jgi:hypothetical protein
MSAADEIRKKAKLFGWDYHEGIGREDVFIHGNHIVYVRYRRGGVVDIGERFTYQTVARHRDIPWWDRSPADDRTPERHKKETVFSWLAEVA